jgi:hypothetical protein
VHLDMHENNLEPKPGIARQGGEPDWRARKDRPCPSRP